MRSHDSTRRTHLAFLLLALGFWGVCVPVVATVQRQADGWVALIDRDGPHGWKEVPKGWEDVGAVHMSAANLRSLAGHAGKGVLFNGRSGRAPNLLTKEDFGDVEAHFEFLVPKGSNSGVKFEGVYEVQLFDSYGVPKPNASHSGGIYPRAELLPKYHHIDEGYPPRINASRPPGEWQTLDVTFRAPRFDATGKKIANAAFLKVVLNGQIVQQDLEIPCPTGNNWKQKEHPAGPILLQGDHGPVAFRSIRVRPLEASSR